MVAFASVRQRLKDTPTDMGREMASEVTMAIEELDLSASTWLEHVLCLSVSACLQFIWKEKKGGGKQIMGIYQGAGGYK